MAQIDEVFEQFAPFVPPAPQISLRDKLADLVEFSSRLLKFAPAAGGARVPALLNPPQRVLHERLRMEADRHSMIRALIPKARQMGVSSYIGLRFFHKCVTRAGTRANVVAHRSEISAKLFEDVKKLYRDLPEGISPSLQASNARELIFQAIGSTYRVMNAAGDAIGRGDNFQLLHLSEAAYFADAEDIASGLMRTVHNEPGTEIMIESTGNGQSGMFYGMCNEAQKANNEGEWRVHFLKWTLMSKYATPRERVPTSWRPPTEFAEYGRLHDLTLPQLHWFWVQNYGIATMNGGSPDRIHRLARQEYPVILSECFLADSTFDFFAPSVVQRCMAKVPVFDQHSPRILAVDPATDGNDPCFVGDRQGSAIGHRVWGELKTSDQNQQADWIISAARRLGIKAIVVDSTGVGTGLVSSLRLRIPEGILLIPIHFGSGATKPLQYGNKRAEIIDRLHRFMEDENASIVNDGKLAEEMACFKWKQGQVRRDETGRLFMPPKEMIRSEIHRSTDRLDTAALTLAIDDRSLPR